MNLAPLHPPLCRQVRDDLDGARTVLQFLAFAPIDVAPSSSSSSPSSLDRFRAGHPPPVPAPVLESSDPVDREVGYYPATGEKLDPRAAIQGPP